MRYTLSRGTGLPPNWTVVGPVTGSNLVVADDNAMWLLDARTASGSTDGGHTWQNWDLGGGVSGYDTVGGTMWLVAGGKVLAANNGGWPAQTAGQPASAEAVTAISADRAIVRGSTDHVTAVWYVTSDHGASWATLADPCAGTAYPATRGATMSAGPGGMVWVVCTAEPVAGQPPKELVTSADGGQTWQRRSTLENTGFANDVYPINADVAWRTGGRGDVYRTTDGGTHWTDVLPGTSGPGGPAGLVAIDADTAIYFTSYTSKISVTRDGGKTWKDYPFLT
jgi:hypothetical protein